MNTQRLLLRLVLILTVFFALQSFRALAQTGTPPQPTAPQTIASPSVAEKTTPSPDVEASPPPNTPWTKLWLFYPLHAVPRNSNLRALVNVISAVLIGWAGAFAFLAGVRYGFIDPTTRDKTLEFLKNPPWWRIIARSTFYSVGGIVAGVFQWAQPDTLVPIQAFVLGATWPSVVTRIMTGGSPAGGTLAQMPAPQLPIPRGRKEEEAEEALATPPPPQPPGPASAEPLPAPVKQATDKENVADSPTPTGKKPEGG